jgi:hypothetical protein
MVRRRMSAVSRTMLRIASMTMRSISTPEASSFETFGFDQAPQDEERKAMCSQSAGASHSNVRAT